MTREKLNYKILIKKLICLIISQKYIKRIENLASQLQGKGTGNFSIFQEINNCKKLLKNRDIKFILDIGANKGDYTEELLKHYKDANYYLFEPSILNYQKLYNKFNNQKNITIINKALSDEEKDDYLFSDTSGSGLASLNKRKLSHLNINFNYKEKVNIVRLDNFFEKFNKEVKIDYCKIDVEGLELKVLLGFGQFIKKIKLIQFEFGGSNIDSKIFFRDFWYFFKGFNFEIYRMTFIGPKIINSYSTNDEFFETTNYIALNKEL